MKIVDLILKAVALAMGVSVTVLSILGAMEPQSAAGLLGIGLTCLAVIQFSKEK